MTTLTTPPRVPDHPPSTLFFRSYTSWRTIFSMGLSILAGTLTIVACVPLFSVLVMLIFRGGHRLATTGLQVFTALPPGPGEHAGGGFANALVGTIVVVALSMLISVPAGIFAAIFLGEYSPNSRLSTTVRFAAKVLTGLPSILAGVFAYAVIVCFTGYSALAGSVALSVLMIPIVLLTAEQAIRMVPAKMKQAAIGMGCTPAQVTWKVVVPTALPGILTGVMLSIARAAGETAPLIFTAFASDYLFAIDAHRPFLHLQRQTASLAVFIFDGSRSPQENLVELAWAASLVLVIMVLIFNIGGQVLSRKSRPRGR